MSSFAIFVISYKRAKKIATVATLRKSGYSGDVYIVVGDDDDQLPDYTERYENVVVFSKDEDESDTVDNFGIKSSALYARNFCVREAERRGIDEFAIFDDDITGFHYRYIVDGKLASKKVDKMDDVVEAFVEFLKTERIGCLSFQENGGYMGGADGIFRKYLVPNPSQTYFLKGYDSLYKGTRCEDDIFNYDMWKTGRCAYAVCGVDCCTPKRMSNSGGLHEDYMSINGYVLGMYSVICDPTSYLVAMENGEHRLRAAGDSRRPLVIAEESKK